MLRWREDRVGQKNRLLLYAYALYSFAQSLQVSGKDLLDGSLNLFQLCHLIPPPRVKNKKIYQKVVAVLSYIFLDSQRLHVHNV